MKFKLNDRVKVIDEQDDRHLIGMIGKVTNLQENGNYQVDFGVEIYQNSSSVNDTTHIFRERELTKARPNERQSRSKFYKIGDIVNIKPSSRHYNQFRRSGGVNGLKIIDIHRARYKLRSLDDDDYEYFNREDLCFKSNVNRKKITAGVLRAIKLLKPIKNELDLKRFRLEERRIVDKLKRRIYL